MKTRLLLLSACLLAARSAAAADCLSPLDASAGWACHAELSNGAAVDYCLEHTHTFGDDPASRFFMLVSTGPYASVCTCESKGASPGAAFGEDKGFLCLDRETDTVTSGKIAARKIAGQTFNGTAAVRGTFTCRPDPVCQVQAVVDRDLPALHATIDLPLSPGQSRENVVSEGTTDVGYLAGCSGYTSEAPTMTYRVDASVSGSIYFLWRYTTTSSNSSGILVTTPSGDAYCGGKDLTLPPASGTYSLWMRSKVSGDPVSAEVITTYLLAP